MSYYLKVRRVYVYTWISDVCDKDLQLWFFWALRIWVDYSLIMKIWSKYYILYIYILILGKLTCIEVTWIHHMNIHNFLK